jgi:hypothetical protein
MTAGNLGNPVPEPQNNKPTVPEPQNNKPTDAERDAYNNISRFHDGQEILFWTRNNILVVLQAGLLAASFAVLTQAKENTDPTLLIALLSIVSIVGLALAVFWVVIVRRSEYIFRQTLYILSTMESAMSLSPAFRAYSRFSEYARTPKESARNEAAAGAAVPQEFRTPHGGRSGIRLSSLWKWVGVGFAVIWLVLGSLPFARTDHGTNRAAELRQAADLRD